MPHATGWRWILTVTLFVSLFDGLRLAAAEESKPFLHRLFTDHVVLQRGVPIPVWGWTTPGATVKVTLNHQSATAQAGTNGKWIARLPAEVAGGPFELEVTGPNAVTVHDVLIGDVWICSGQSNMEMGIQQVNNPDAEIADARRPQIRLFTVPHKTSFHPIETVDSQWLVCSPETVKKDGWGGFSAVGYFFGRALQEDLQVPIGLIHTSWGGTIAEAWTSGDRLLDMDDFADAVREIRKQDEAANSTVPLPQRIQKWWANNDPGSQGDTWAIPSLDTGSWKSMKLPALWEEAGLPDYDGVVWFRKAVELPADWDGKAAVLHLGPIDDNDTTYINGQQVGSTDGYNIDRKYDVKPSILKAGRNLIAIRVLDTGGGGGIYGKATDLRLIRTDNPSTSVDLAGDWKYAASASLKKTAPFPDRLDNNPNVVTVLYNGMIAPLIPFGIKGAIWYQGESNAGRAAQYRTLLATLIEDWRSRFEVGPFPFFVVQLANFMAAKPEPGESAWAELREAQVFGAARAGNSGVALAIDIGDAQDIHPKNKQEVGRRLALAARAIAYHESIPYSGPVYRELEIKGHRAVVHFDHVHGGLTVHDGPKLKGFAIAGADKHFVWADAVVEGDTVVLSAPSIAQPAHVRYDWADNPDGNLYNQAGLPTVPFRTDAP